MPLVVTIAMFPSLLGMRPGLLESAEMLRSQGHAVHVVDQLGGRVFEGYQPAMAQVDEIGFSALLEGAIRATAALPEPMVALGFSLGACMAQYVGAHRPVRGVVMLGGAVDPRELGVDWPSDALAQVHTTVDDPWREQPAIDGLVAAASAVGAVVEVYDYPGRGHLFADSSKVDEYQPAEARLMWTRVLDLLERAS